MLVGVDGSPQAALELAIQKARLRHARLANSFKVSPDPPPPSPPASAVSQRVRHKEGVSGRIDLGARRRPALTACIGVTSRGVRAAHTLGTGVPGGRRRRQARTFERCGTHDRAS